MAGLMGAAFVAIWHDVVPEGKAEFYAWHTRQHMPERLRVTGFLCGRRYVVRRGTPEFFNLYEVQTADVLTSDEYIGRLNNPTPWTQRALPYFRNVSRSLCRVGLSYGRSQGGVVLTARGEATPGREAELTRFLHDTLATLFDQPGIVGAHCGQADRSGSEIVTAERKARGNVTSVPGWVVLLEGVSGAAVEAAAAALDVMSMHGAQGVWERATYQLECCLTNAGHITPESAKKM